MDIKNYLGFSKIQLGKSVKKLFNLELPKEERSGATVDCRSVVQLIVQNAAKSLSIGI